MNLIKEYPDLLELLHLTEGQRKQSLYRIFKRDFDENAPLFFRSKQIRPIKKEDGESALDTMFHHLTTKDDKNEEGKKIKRRIFELERSQRLHWVKYLLEGEKMNNVEVFSYMDRTKKRGDVIRTYIYDKDEEYVIILEPQRSGKDYYLLTAYYLNEKRGRKQIKQKMKRKLPDIH